MPAKEYKSFYVAEDGNWGTCNILLIDQGSFTRAQMEILSELGDNYRYEYARAVVTKQNLEQWEEEY